MKNPNKTCLILSTIFLVVGLWNLLGIGSQLWDGKYEYHLGKIQMGGYLSIIGSMGLLFQLYIHNFKK